MAVPPPHPQADASTAKQDARAALRRNRTAFVAQAGPETLAVHAAALAGRLYPLLESGGPIAGYVAHRGEPDILPVLRAAHDRGLVVALPRTDGGTAMRFVTWLPSEPLTPGALGILEPAVGEEVVPATVLAPLIGFDRTGGRLGQGGAYYDRWFVAHPQALRVGIAWSVQEAAVLPSDAWDIPLHAVATEKEWLQP